jgi:hypothetical protein
MRIRCIPVQATLAARGEVGLSGSMWSHIEVCETCTPDLADHRQFAAAMTHLRTSSFVAPPEIVHRVMHDIGPWAVPEPEPRDQRAARAAAAAVATAAATAVAGTAVLMLRHRQRVA